MTDQSDERVLVVPTKVFYALGHFQGFSHGVDRYMPGIFGKGVVSYRPRSEVEEDPTFKQLIPYVIFRYRDDQGRTSLFQYTRGGNLGEARLHGNRSIGVGGHIAIDDAISESNMPYDAAMRRELHEEVVIDTPCDIQCVGFINDDNKPVGQVHLGIVHIATVERPVIRPRDQGLLNGRFQSVKSMSAQLDEFETWSRLCLQSLFA